MPIHRATMIFTATTGLGRTGGWSESWYKDGTSEAIMLSLNALCAARANTLAEAARIAGQRVQRLGGRTVTNNLVFPGRGRLTVDVPQMAAQCSVATLGNTQKKGFSMRGVPDDFVTSGDYTPAAGGARAFNEFFAALGNEAFQWRARDTSLPAVNIVSIDAGGVFALAGAIDFAVGDFLTMVRVRGVAGNSIVGNFYVSARTDAQHGTLFNWTGGAVVMKGKVRKTAFTYPVCSANTGKVIRIMVRKVGRPFDQYRGRATKRR